MQSVCVRGVVRGGQVVLEVPLELHDGAVVFITTREPSGVGVPPNDTAGTEADKRRMLTLLDRLDLLDDPDWRKKAEPDRAAYFEKLVLEAVEMRAKREAANSEQQMSQSRGSRE